MVGHHVHSYGVTSHGLGLELFISRNLNVYFVNDLSDFGDRMGWDQLVEVDFEGSASGISVKTDVDKPVVAKFPSPDLFVILVNHQVCLNSRSILIDSDHLFVSKDVQSCL